MPVAITKRQTRAQFKTYKNVFDDHAERVLFKLSSQGHFKHLAEPISIGKEANIFSAMKYGPNGEEQPIIVKIYRLETCDFNRMYSYIRYDTRFLNLKKKRRLIIFTWCKREFQNLLKAREAGCRVPTPIAFRDNVLLMEYIHNHGETRPSPQLKDQIPEDPQAFYEDVQQQMARLNKAGLAHGDLSAFNILNRDEKPVLIDFSQCSPLDSANAQELIDRDHKNVNTFFKKLGVKVREENKH